MSETTLRLRTQADVAALRQWSAAVREAREEVSRFGSAASQAGGATGGGGMPTMPGVATPGGGTAPGGGGPPGGTSPAPPGFPQGSGAPMAPPPPPSQGAPPMAPPPPSMGGGGGGYPGGGGQMVQPGSATDRGGRFLYGMGATAIGLGLGASLTGFLLTSGQKYLELSKIITVVGQRFQEAQGNVIGFGGAMGYTLATTAGLVEALGSVTNRVDQSTFLSYSGFARQQGIDPHASLGTFGRLGAMRGYGGTLSTTEMAEMVGRAQLAGMGQGRLPEFMQGMMSLGETGFQATGKMDWRALMAASKIPGLAFGDYADPRATGQSGASMIQGLHGMMTGGGPMQTFMMRAMGYGSPGGPGYIEMRERTQAGIFDPRNIKDMFGAMRARGWGPDAMFKALEAPWGNRPAWQLKELVRNFGSEKGMAAFQKEYGSDQEGMSRYLASLSAEERQKYEAGGFEALGKGAVGEGDWRDVKMEAMQMKVGKPVAEAMVDLTDTLVNIAGTLKNLIGVDLGKILTDATSALERVSKALEEGTRKGGVIRQTILAPSAAMTDEQAANIMGMNIGVTASEAKSPLGLGLQITGAMFGPVAGGSEAGGGH